jgi:hypothetical protein
MKKTFLFHLVFLFLFSSAIFSQDTGHQNLNSLFKEHGVVYFSFTVKDKAILNELTHLISIDNYQDDRAFAYANRDEFDKFLEYRIPYTILPLPSTLLTDSELNMGAIQKDSQGRTTWNFYPTYQQYLDFMNGFAASYPDICKVVTIGTTTQNRQLIAVKITDNVNIDEGEPQFLYTSSIHGDEVTGYICMLHLIDSLLSGYSNSPRITNIVNNYEIYINPLANPDGTYHGGNNTVYGATRENANGIDINRNYPDPKAGPHPDGHLWQPETQAFMNFADSNHFVMSMNFHGGAEVFNYPWDTWVKLHPDDSWFYFLGREYADTVHKFAPSGYMTDLMNGVTNGNAWYEITGGRQDYMTYFQHGREVTLEISANKMPPANTLLNYWKYNNRSFLNYLEQCAYGINGMVTDSVTGQPLRAKIVVTGHDADSSFVYSKLPSGWYYRPIYQGTWSLDVISPGYFPKTISGVSVTNLSTTRLNIKLVPLNIGGVGNETFEIRPLVYPNPTTGLTQLLIPGNSRDKITATLFNSLGTVIFSREFDGIGDASVPLDLRQYPKGFYFLEVNSGNKTFTGKVILE